MATIWQGTAFIKGLRLGGSNDNDGGKPPKLYRGADQLFPKSVPYVEELTYDVVITTTAEFLPLPNTIDSNTTYPNPEDPGNWIKPVFNEEYFTDTYFHYGKLFMDRTDRSLDINWLMIPTAVAAGKDFIVEDGQIKYNFVNPGDATFNQAAFAATGSVPSTNYYVDRTFGNYLTAVDINIAMGEGEVQPSETFLGSPHFGQYTFTNTTMTSIKVKGMTHMPVEMFGGVNGATSVSQTDDTAGIYLPDLTDMSYAAKAFLDSSTLTSISLPNVTRIGDRRLFHGCSNVTEIDLSGLDPALHVDSNGATRLAWNIDAWGLMSNGEPQEIRDLFDSTGTYLVFRDLAPGCRLKIPAAFQTSDNGAPDPEIVAFLAQGEGRTVEYVS